jgi:hypothetical protein
MDDEDLLEIVKQLGGADDPGDTDEFDDLDELRDEHAASEDDAWDESAVSDTLAKWLDSDDATVRRGAAIALGEVAAGVLLQQVKRRLPSRLLGENLDESRLPDLVEGISRAVGQLHEHYFGSYCPGCLTALTENPDEHQREYEKLERAACPVAEYFRDQKCGSDLAKLVMDVRPKEVI